MVTGDVDVDEDGVGRKREFGSEEEGTVLRYFLRNLFDLQMRTVLSIRMLPLIYLLGVVVAACGALYLIGEAFGRSWTDGLLWLLIIGPLGFIGAVTALRVTLEFVMSVFRILLYVEAVAERTEVIAEDLPRMQFWRGWWRGRPTQE